MRVFVLFLLLVVAGCSSIQSDGKQCNKEEGQNCEIYVPVFSPLKLLVVSFIE